MDAPTPHLPGFYPPTPLDGDIATPKGYDHGEGPLEAAGRKLQDLSVAGDQSSTLPDMPAKAATIQPTAATLLHSEDKELSVPPPMARGTSSNSADPLLSDDAALAAAFLATQNANHSQAADTLERPAPVSRAVTSDTGEPTSNTAPAATTLPEPADVRLAPPADENASTRAVVGVPVASSMIGSRPEPTVDADGRTDAQKIVDAHDPSSTQSSQLPPPLPMHSSAALGGASVAVVDHKPVTPSASAVHTESAATPAPAVPSKDEDGHATRNAGLAAAGVGAAGGAYALHEHHGNNSQSLHDALRMPTSSGEAVPPSSTSATGPPGHSADATQPIVQQPVKNTQGDEDHSKRDAAMIAGAGAGAGAGVMAASQLDRNATNEERIHRHHGADKRQQLNDHSHHGLAPGARQREAVVQPSGSGVPEAAPLQRQHVEPANPGASGLTALTAQDRPTSSLIAPERHREADTSANTPLATSVANTLPEEKAQRISRSAESSPRSSVGRASQLDGSPSAAHPRGLKALVHGPAPAAEQRVDPSKLSHPLPDLTHSPPGSPTNRSPRVSNVGNRPSGDGSRAVEGANHHRRGSTGEHHRNKLVTGRQPPHAAQAQSGSSPTQSPRQTVEMSSGKPPATGTPEKGRRGSSSSAGKSGGGFLSKVFHRRDKSDASTSSK